ncbi:MAG: glycosyltransferase family 2 protein [Janthinobacterium lividum]
MRIAAVLLVKNEARDLLEWLAFQFVVGFDAVIVLDNGSTDGTADVVRMAAQTHDVRLLDWPSVALSSHADAYDHALALFGAEFDWMAFLDADEFLLPLRHGSVPALLESLDAHAAVGVHWAVFGSSRLVDWPKGLVIDSFLHRAREDFVPNRHIKSIVRPREVVRCHLSHWFEMKGARLESDGWHDGYVDPDGRPIHWEAQAGVTRDQPDFATARLHHYFTRSLAHWRVKMARRWLDVERTDDAFVEHDRNEVLDASALRYVAAVKREMAAMRAGGLRGLAG